MVAEDCDSERQILPVKYFPSQKSFLLQYFGDTKMSLKGNQNGNPTSSLTERRKILISDGNFWELIVLQRAMINTTKYPDTKSSLHIFCYHYAISPDTCRWLVLAV